jgi:hypothetical protein
VLRQWEAEALVCLFCFWIPGVRDAIWGSDLSYKIHFFQNTKKIRIEKYKIKCLICMYTYILWI